MKEREEALKERKREREKNICSLTKQRREMDEGGSVWKGRDEKGRGRKNKIVFTSENKTESTPTEHFPGIG